MQFTAMVLLSLFALTLAFLLPRRSVRDKAFSQARWLITVGLTILAVQFLLQYTFHFREMGGVIQGVLVNLLFFIPCTVLLNLAILSLQQQGRLTWRDWLPGVAGYGITVALLTGAAIIATGQPLAETAVMYRAEYAAGIAYCLVQVYYSYRVNTGNRRLHNALQNFYDQDMGDMLRWMERSVVILSMNALFVPFLIFSSGIPLLAYALVIFLSIYYLVFSFICYGVSSDSRHVTAAEENAEATEMEDDSNTGTSLSVEEKERIERAVERWLAAHGHLRNGITMPVVCDEMGLPRYLFATWIKTTEQGLFSPWLTHLRIEEAKQMLKLHPDWSNDVVAEHCGFSTRNYFQTVFRRATGMTPAQYASK